MLLIFLLYLIEIGGVFCVSSIPLASPILIVDLHTKSQLAILTTAQVLILYLVEIGSIFSAKTLPCIVNFDTNFPVVIPSSTHFPKHWCKFIPPPLPTATVTKPLVELATAS